MKESYKTLRESEEFLKFIKFAEDNKYKLRKAIYELNRLSFDKGTRSGDYSIREKIKSINAELDHYDNKIKSCVIDRNDIHSLNETLKYFEDNLIDHYSLGEKIESLKEECVNQAKADLEHNIRHSDENYKRSSVNILRIDLDKDIVKFEKNITTIIIPLVNVFLNYINALLLYERIKEKINISIISNSNIFTDKDDTYTAFENGFKYYFKLNIKINQDVLTDKNALKLIYDLLDRVDCGKDLLSLDNIDGPKLDKIIKKCSEEFCVKNSLDNRANEEPGSGDIIDAGAANKINNDHNEFIYKDLQNILKDLCAAGDKLYINTQIMEKEKIFNKNKRFAFHCVGSEKISLKIISEYLRDSLLFVNEWLYSEIKKDPETTKPLKPLLACIPIENDFNNLFGLACNVANEEKNNLITFIGEIKQYISIETAENLIESILSSCNKIRDAFFEILFELEGAHSAELKIIFKKTQILLESFDSAQKQIKSNLARLAKY